MSFQHTSCDIHLDTQPGATLLAAICNSDEGSGLTCNVLLDECLGNEDGKISFESNTAYTPTYILGHFRWGAKNFSQHARHTFLSLDGPDRTPVLHSELENSSGGFVQDEVNLGTHICNIEGQLTFTG
jgi:hypothetical protein